MRPLDDLMAKYRQELLPNQLIRIDGKVMAIAVMANAEHSYCRRTCWPIQASPRPRRGRTCAPPLETMKALAGYRGPDDLTWSSNAMPALRKANRIAISNFWRSEAVEVLPGTEKAPTAAPFMPLTAAPGAPPRPGT